MSTNGGVTPVYNPDDFIRIRGHLIAEMQVIYNSHGADMLMDLLSNIIASVATDLNIKEEQLIGAVRKAYEFYQVKRN